MNHFNADATSLTGFVLGLALLPLAALAVYVLGVGVREGEVVLVRRFGRLVRELKNPGWHFIPDRCLPWVAIERISTRREFRTISDVAVNDAQGTTVVVDVFLELRIVDAAKASFSVADRELALTNLVSHALISVLGTRTAEDIICERGSLAEELRRETSGQTARWGVRVERALLRNVSLLPDVSQQLLRSVSARIERWKADIEEAGRQRGAMLEAKTSAEIAELVARARAEYPAAIGRAYKTLEALPRVCEAYNELYELSLMHPTRTVAFVGFDADEVRPVDAAMLLQPNGDEGTGHG